MTAEELRELQDQIAASDGNEWIDGATSERVEQYMPDLAARLPAKRTETFDQAFGQMRAKAKRKVTAKQGSRRRRASPICATGANDGAS